MSDNKYKINIDRPQISKEEIEGYKDFNSFLGAAQNIHKPMIQRPQVWAWSGLAAACTVALVYFIVFYTTKNVPVASHPYINPPIENVQIKYVDYEVPADSGMTIHCASGTDIVIPKNAFTDKNGNIVKGKVKLKYREFHDMAECFISGIPMSYDSAGKQYDFQTAGMFDMSASSGDMPAYIATGKNIRVEMASWAKENKFNFYKLDTVRKKWAFLGKDTGRVKDTIIPLKNKGRLYKKVNASRKTSSRPPDLEAIIENMVFESPKIMQVEKQSFPPRPIAPKKADPNVQTFTLDVLPDQFPELASYKDVVFEVGKENKNFDKSSFKITWQDLKLTQGTKPGSYNLTMSTLRRKYSIIVYPVFKGSDYDSAVKVYNKKFKDYEASLKAKEKVRIAKSAWQDKVQKARNNNSTNPLTDTGSKIPDVSDFGARRVFEINSFGIYNCDHPCEFDNPVNVNIMIEDKKGNPLVFGTIYLVDLTRKFVHLYSGYAAETDIKFNPADNNMLFGLLPGNKIAICKNEKLAMLSNKNHGTATIAMDIPDARVNDLNDLRDFVFGNAKNDNLP